MSLAASRDACMGQSTCDVGKLEVKARRYDEKLSVVTKVLGAFGCEATIEVSLPSFYQNSKKIDRDWWRKVYCRFFSILQEMVSFSSIHAK